VAFYVPREGVLGGIGFGPRNRCRKVVVLVCLALKSLAWAWELGFDVVGLGVGHALGLKDVGTLVGREVGADVVGRLVGAEVRVAVGVSD